jgi:hypothetical protein
MIPTRRRSRYAKNLLITKAQTVLSVPGQEYAQMPSSSRGRCPSPGLPKPAASSPNPAEAHVSDLFGMTDDFDVTGDIFVTHGQDDEELRRQRRRKKERQWKKWTDNVIPSLLRPHLNLLRQSESLRSIPQHPQQQCTCYGSSCRLKVICVFFEGECCVLFVAGISTGVGGLTARRLCWSLSS